MISRLSLAFPDINSVEQIFMVDTSYYNEDLPVTCQTVRILVPGRTRWVKKEFKKKNFYAVFNSSALALTKRGVRGDLPDGVYEVEYSIAPNDKIWVTYYYFKTDAIDKRLMDQMCSQFANREILKKDREDNLRKLDEIDRNIRIAKASAQNLGEKENAIQLYEWADRMLKGFEEGCKTCK